MATTSVVPAPTNGSRDAVVRFEVPCLYELLDQGVRIAVWEHKPPMDRGLQERERLGHPNPLCLVCVPPWKSSQRWDPR